ncbi:hypothetical protein MMC28_000199 [Mycoblastus sanguinarius]|nr:hypothetical protein [Mycoblastus sanguinarius]
MELSNLDVEQDSLGDSHLTNSTVRRLAWHGVCVRVSSSTQTKRILSNIDGYAEDGQLTAPMGPSGSGKTTLLNVLAHRKPASRLEVSAHVTVNGSAVSRQSLQNMSSYVEQEDALIGSLTVRETLSFAARLSLPSTVSSNERRRRVDQLLHAFGLQNQAHTIVGTPIRKGISDGQKRRLSIASQLITAPKILFLDEPTSGLDSTASYEVIKYLKSIAREQKYSPTFIGNVRPIRQLFTAFGRGDSNAFVIYNNPAEFLLDLTSSDFSLDSPEAQAITKAGSETSTQKEIIVTRTKHGSGFFNITLALLHRSFIKSYRDVVAYGIRFAMYIGLAIMMGTVWLRLPTTQCSIGPFANAIFFGSAFMSFMAVAYVPAFLGDRATFIKERANGLYGAAPFMIANFLIGLPYLFLISIIFSLIAYFLTNFRPTASAFFIWVMWLFLDLLAGESLVVLMSSIFPNFVISLALTAFANGLWMSVGGFLVSPEILNPFWRYVFHYIDYQAYVFRGMMVNEFGYRTYDCGEGCHCMYQTELASQCKIDSQGVLEQYGYRDGNTGKWVGILLAILFVYRVLGWAVTHVRKT